MPTLPTYPGVYIEEVPSGVRTITGVSTSITAFVGRTFKGPIDHATRVTHFGAFEKHFGGLWRESTLSYAIRQFFQNGGTDAVVVRIANANGAASTVTLDNGTPNGIQLFEANAGSSGHTLRIQVTDDGTRSLYCGHKAVCYRYRVTTLVPCGTLPRVPAGSRRRTDKSGKIAS